MYVCMYGLGVVCMYLRRLVGIGMYVCMYVRTYVCMRWGWFLGLGVLPPWNPTIMQGTSASPPPPVGWVGCSMYVPT